MSLIEPHGGELVDLLVDDARVDELRATSRDWPSWDLTRRQLDDLELLLTGAFSPLRGFLGKDDYESVRDSMRLVGGVLWPIPVMLDVAEEFAADLERGSQVALRGPEGMMFAVLTVNDVWKPDLLEEAEKVFGSTNPEHPGVSYLLNESNPWYVGGTLEGLRLPTHHDFQELRKTPRQLRDEFEVRAWSNIVAFQTRNPMHRAHVELTARAAEETGGHLLIHPVVGLTRPGDVDHYTRVRVYKAIQARYPEGSVSLALLNLAMRMGGPREALWHAIIRKNHGVTHFIVGRDHAGPGVDADGNPFYGPYEAQDLVIEHQEELGITMVPFRLMVYVPEDETYVPIDDVSEETEHVSISGTELRHRLATGEVIPEWFSYPEVVHELRRTHRSRAQQGFTVFFTGLSGSGKSAIANALTVKLLQRGGRTVTLLDGDIVRKNLSKGLGFSKEDRDINVLRIGYVASEITRAGGAAICAPIAPYGATREQNRKLIARHGGYVLVWVATPLEVCEQRDSKGLYAKARAGIIKEFTGISDPYEEPVDAEIVLQTTELSPDQAADTVIDFLVDEGYLPKEA